MKTPKQPLSGDHSPYHTDYEKLFRRSSIVHAIAAAISTAILITIMLTFVTYPILENITKGSACLPERALEGK